MGALQIILLIIGVLVLVAVYLWDRLRTRRPEEAPRSAQRRVEPEPEADAVAAELAGLRDLIAEDRPGGPAAAPRRAAPVAVAAPDPAVPTTSGREHPAPTPPGSAKLLVLQLAAPAGVPFRGEDLLRAFAGEGLEHGAMRIYHRHVPPAAAPLFSVANLVEPGYFEPDAMAGFTTPGLILLQQLPGPRPGPEAFQAMLGAAQRLAEHLGGELRDERRNPLTHQRIEALRAEVMEHERRRHLPQVGA